MKRKSVLAAGAMAAVSAVTGTTALAAVTNPQLLGIGNAAGNKKQVADAPVDQAQQVDGVAIVATPAAYIETPAAEAPAVAEIPAASANDGASVLGASFVAPEHSGVQLASAYVPVAPIPQAPPIVVALAPEVTHVQTAAPVVVAAAPVVVAAGIPDPIGSPPEVPVVVVIPPAPKPEVTDPPVVVAAPKAPAPAVHHHSGGATKTTQPATDAQDD